MSKVYIHTNNKQLIGAKVGKFLWNKLGFNNVEIINVDENPCLDSLWGKEYLRGGKLERFSRCDLQSFTLSRFLPESLSDDKYIVTDPDVFPVSKYVVSNIEKLFSSAWNGIYATKGKTFFNSSVMIRTGKKSPLWNFEKILEALVNKQVDYNDIMLLKFIRPKVDVLESVFNSFDKLDADTLLLHNTRRITQPWKEGLPVDFINHKTPKYLRAFERNKVKVYQKHPDVKQIEFFIDSLRGALLSGFVNSDELKVAVDNYYVRPDIFEKLDI